jgi:hypothetical protein
MPVTPVVTTMWLDPPEQTDFQVNDAVTVHMSFVDRETKVPVTPDLLYFNYSNPPVAITPVTLTYPVGITLDATGSFHLDLPLTASGRWVLNAQPQGNPGAVPIGGATMEIYVYGTGL